MKTHEIYIVENKKLDEVAPVVAGLWTAARVAAPWLVRHGWKLLKGTGKLARKHKKTTAITGLGIYAKDEIAAISEFLKGTGEAVEPLLKYAKDYALPLMAVFAIVYGGKKVVDAVMDGDEEELKVLAEADVEYSSTKAGNRQHKIGDIYGKKNVKLPTAKYKDNRSNKQKGIF